MSLMNVMGKLEPTANNYRQVAGYNLDRSPIYHKSNTETDINIINISVKMHVANYFALMR